MTDGSLGRATVVIEVRLIDHISVLEGEYSFVLLEQAFSKLACNSLTTINHNAGRLKQRAEMINASES